MQQVNKDCKQVAYDGSKTFEYLQVIRQHVIYPLRNTAVAESCFAAATLIFGAVDGLGRLIHDDVKARPGERFRFFISRLGEPYAKQKNALWVLRNSLAHNAINVACFMSKMEQAWGQHLEQCEGYLFVQTKEMLQDFEVAFAKLEDELQNNPALLQRTESRLQSAPILSSAWIEFPTTKPPPVEFIQL